MDITSKDCNFTFIPVQINRGRKFKGFAYLIEGGYTYTRGYHNSGVDPFQAIDYAKVWDPASKRTYYVNAEYPEDVVQEESKTQIDKDDYVKSIIQSTIDWCRSKSSNEENALQFARNVLRKHHPELMPAIDIATPDKRDTAVEIEKTLKWAMNLRTKPMHLYGHDCKGGKKYPDKKVVSIAYRALEKKGITKVDGFNEVWDLHLTILGLPKFG